MTPEQIAELEALAAYVVRLPSGVERANAKAELALFVTHNLPVILAALKAQQPDDAMVERVATVLAPFVCRPVHNGDCDDIAAGQSHARYVARTALAAWNEGAWRNAARTGGASPGLFPNPTPLRGRSA